MAFDRCRLGWFEARSRKPTSKGLSFIFHSAAYRPQPKAAARKWSGFDLESQDLQPDDQVNHRDDQRGSHERFRQSAWRVNYGRDQHVRPGDLQGASERLLPRWGVRPLPVTAGVLLK